MILNKLQNIIVGILKLMSYKLITIEDCLQCLMIKKIHFKNNIDKIIIIPKSIDKLRWKNIDQK